MNNLWPTQAYAIDAVCEAIADGVKRICLSSPTGTGKSRVVCVLIDIFAARNWHVVLYTNRKMLIEQLEGVLRRHGIKFGIRAAGHEDKRELPIQISSLPTEQKRTVQDTGGWQLHGHGVPNCLAIIDEVHVNKGPTAQAICEKHARAGHVVLGVTATPLELGGMFDKLIVAGKTSDGRKCGALVVAKHYGPDEPDMKQLADSNKEPTEKEIRKAMNHKLLFGRVMHWFDRLNLSRRPTILFAAGVAESLWFAEEFCRRGIPAAHIDGQDVWINGELSSSDKTARDSVIRGSECGAIKVVCNRFVLREGLDMPWLQHGIFATVFGSLSTYLQAGGRLLRADPSHDHVTIQDHGGNWVHYGSLNADRNWRLGDTNAIHGGIRADRMRAKKDREPYRCSCGMILATRVCPECGATTTKRSRPVYQSDGTMKEMTGDIFKPRKVAQFTGAQGKWVTMYWRSAKMKNHPRTFRAAEALYAAENFWQWPDRNWPFMPLYELDFYELVKDVPMDRLRR